MCISLQQEMARLRVVATATLCHLLDAAVLTHSSSHSSHHVPRPKQGDVMGKGWKHMACASMEGESSWGSPKPDHALPPQGVIPSGEAGGPWCHAQGHQWCPCGLQCRRHP